MTGGLSDIDRSRMARSGMSALSAEEGLALFDKTLETGEASLLPVALDLRGTAVACEEWCSAWRVGWPGACSWPGARVGAADGVFRAAFG